MKSKVTLIITIVLIAALALLYTRDRTAPGQLPQPAASSDPIPTASAKPAPEIATTALAAPSVVTNSRPDQDYLESFCPEYSVNTLSENMLKKLEAEMRSVLSETQSQLAQSTQADHLYVAAMMEQNKTKSVSLIKRAIDADPRNKHSYRFGLITCMRSPTPDGCQNSEWEQSLIALDRENSDTWMMVAANRYHRGETRAAFQALEQAASAEESTLYWVDNIELAASVLEAGGMRQFSHRTQTAVALAAVSSPSFSRYTRMCREQSLENPAWAQACLTFGERSAVLSPTFLGESIARAIQIQAHKALRNEQIVQQLEDVQTARKVKLYTSNGSQQQKEMHLTFSVPELFYSYLNLLRSNGELGATELIRDEIKQYVEKYPNRACETLLQEISVE